jgi:hypothetical protein
LVHGLTFGNEVVIVEIDQPVARIILAAAQPQNPLRRLGALRGTVLYMAPDSGAPLEEFKEYMEFNSLTRAIASTLIMPEMANAAGRCPSRQVTNHPISSSNRLMATSKFLPEVS